MDTAVDLIPIVLGLLVGIAFVISFSTMFDANVPALSTSESAIITIDRTVCFGSCPDYSLTIYGNGTVIYDGRNFVAITGRQTSTIPQEDVRELIRSFYSIGYFSLIDEYVDQVTDLPTTTTSITIGGQFKQVINYYGAPESLRQLENKIDETANSGIWIEGTSNLQ